MTVAVGPPSTVGDAGELPPARATTIAPANPSAAIAAIPTIQRRRCWW
ncbi:MAG: hypothetical protein JO363_06270 [Solirubrobacterales bacterium]|nr:hypothetical protein [Solirubrobacterales bacterium]